MSTELTDREIGVCVSAYCEYVCVSPQGLQLPLFIGTKLKTQLCKNMHAVVLLALFTYLEKSATKCQFI